MGGRKGSSCSQVVLAGAQVIHASWYMSCHVPSLHIHDSLSYSLLLPSHTCSPLLILELASALSIPACVIPAITLMGPYPCMGEE